MISENQDSLNRESVITAYALTEASRNSLSAAGNVRVLLRGHSRTYSEHQGKNLPPATSFLRTIAFPQQKNMQRFSNQL